MREIKLKIPEWAQERSIYIFAGGEVLANYCSSEGTFWIKSTRCNLCGKCCIVDETFYNWTLPTKSGSAVGWDEGLKVCEYLEKEIWNFGEYDNQTVYACKAPATVKPWACMIGFTCGKDDWKDWKPFCVIDYKKVE